MLVSALTEVQTSACAQPGPSFWVMQSGETQTNDAPSSPKETWYCGCSDLSLSDFLGHYGDTHSIMRVRLYGGAIGNVTYLALSGDMASNKKALDWDYPQACEWRILSGGKWRPVPLGFWQGR